MDAESMRRCESDEASERNPMYMRCTEPVQARNPEESDVSQSVAKGDSWRMRERIRQAIDGPTRPVENRYRGVRVPRTSPARSTSARTSPASSSAASTR